MKEVSFTFRGKVYNGFLAASTDEYPHYYWCFISDPQLVKEVGDCISLQQDKGGPLQPTENYPPRYNELLQAVKALAEKIMVAGPGIDTLPAPLSGTGA